MLAKRIILIGVFIVTIVVQFNFTSAFYDSLEVTEKSNRDMPQMFEKLSSVSGSLMRIKKDTNGNVIGVTNAVKGGIISETMVYDDRNNLIQMTLSATAGKSGIGRVADGYSGTEVWKLWYDANDKLITFSVYDNANSLVYTEFRKLDGNLRTIEYGKYDAGGKALSGSVVSRYSYDLNGNVVWEQFFWSDGKLQEKKDYNEEKYAILNRGIAAYGYVYDGKSRLIETRTYGADWKLKNDSIGRSAVERVYFDDQWNKTKAIFDASGKLLLVNRYKKDPKLDEIMDIMNGSLPLTTKNAIDAKINSLSYTQKWPWINNVLGKLKILWKRKLSAKNLNLIDLLKTYLQAKLDELTILEWRAEISPDQLLK